MLRQLFSSVRWSIAGRSVTTAIGFITGIILARLIAPEQFGLYAMAAVFGHIASITVDPGISDAIVSKQHTTSNNLLSTSFWLSITAGLLTAVSLLLLSPLAGALYSSTVVPDLIIALAVGAFIESLGTAAHGLLRKTLKFAHISITQIIAELGASIIPIVLAYHGWGVWALVVQYISRRAITAVLYISFANTRLPRRFSLADVKLLRSFAQNLTVAKILNYVRRKADDFIVGSVLGNASLGYYDKAYSIFLRPIGTISSFVNPVAHSGLAAHAQSTASARRIYLTVLSGNISIFLPLAALLFIYRQELVLLTIGPNWLPVVPLLGIFAITFITDPIDKLHTTVLKAMDRTDITLRTTLFTLPLFIIGFTIGAQFGVLGVAVGFVTCSIVLTSWRTYETAVCIKVRPQFYLKNLLPPTVYALTFVILLATFILASHFLDLPAYVENLAVAPATIAYLSLHYFRPLDITHQFLKLSGSENLLQTN